MMIIFGSGSGGMTIWGREERVSPAQRGINAAIDYPAKRKEYNVWLGTARMCRGIARNSVPLGDMVPFDEIPFDER
jgi:hypothetical protein